MAGKKWEGWVCGNCKARLRDDEVLPPVMPDDDRYMHAVELVEDYFDGRVRTITSYCGPVRHYPRKEG